MFSNFKNIKRLYKKKFLIFEIEDFLSENGYNKIYDNFPKLNNDELKSLAIGNGKFSINPEQDSIYNSKITSNKDLEELHNLFSNKKI